MAAIRSSRSVTQERRRRRSDGSIIDVLHTVSPICDAAGRIVGVSTISRDITVRKKSEQAIQDTIRNRDHFLAMLSHELRNPLSAILYAAQMLDMRKSIDGNDTEASDVIRRQAEQMRLLLDDLLDVARVTQNKIVLRREVVSLGDIVAEELRTIERLPETSRRVIEVQGMDQVCLVDGDPARLHQVVINLLRNAVKYSSDGGTITVKLSRQDNQAVLSVRDTGVGIAPDMLDQIFELFVQSRDTIDRAEGGLGVGLTLVRAIVELHGGTIRAFSQGTGFGSEFTIQLPLAVSQPSSAKLDKAKTGETQSVPLPSLRIAIIEDNSDVQLCLRTLLEMDGNEVRVSCDGIEGTDLILEWCPDIAIVDIGLPGRDGFGVAREVRKRISAEHNRPQPHLIALTGYGLPSDRVKVLEAGFNLHLVKPVNLDELFDVLHRIASG
jgi:two-component system CheB/CheR fusion protein